MTRHRCVLFDLDGTLVDSLADLADSMNRVLIRQGLPPHPTEAYRYFVGDGMVNLVQRALPPGNNNRQDLIQDCVREMRQEYGLHWADTTRPYPGIAELLDALASRGIEMAILSNKPDRLTQEVVRTLLPNWHFAAVAGAKETIARKPDPAGALHIANLLHREPADFLYLGDTNTDMQTAIAAGMMPVGVLWGFRTKAELEEAGAQAVLHHPLDLLKLA